MAWFKPRRQDIEEAATAAPTPSETEALLPNSEEHRPQRRIRTSGSPLWLLPAVAFVLIMTFLTREATIWFFGGAWVSEAEPLSIDIDYTDRLGFWIEGKGKIEGTLEVVEIPKNEQPKLEVQVYTLTWDNEGVKSVQLENSPGGVSLKYDRASANSLLKSHPPIKVHAKLHLRVASLHDLSINTNNLNINLDIPNAHLTSASISSHKGSINAVTNIRALDTEVHSLTGKISGHFSLYERLKIWTESGDIKLHIISSEAQETGITDIHSTSGDINVDFPEPYLHRSHKTALQTVTGNIFGYLLLGENLSVRSDTGDIGITVVPTNHKEPFLKTQSSSGCTKLSISKRPLGKLISSHTTESGDLDVDYPSNWEGEVHAKVGSGDIMLTGEGLRVSQDSEGLVRGQEIWAEKGSPANGRLMARSATGDIVISIDS